MNDKQRKAKILKSIKEAQADGYTLVHSEWGSGLTKCACALGCIFVADGINPFDGFATEEKAAARYLDTDEDWILSFTDGFDGNGNDKGAHYPEAWRMGAEIREETKPVDYLRFIDQMDLQEEEQ